MHSGKSSLRILLSDTDSAVDDGGGMCRAGLAGLADDARAGDDDQGYGHLNSGGNDTAATTATVTTAAATTAAGTTAAATTAVETAPAATTGGFNSGVPLQFRCRLRGDIGGVVSASLVSLVTCRLVLLSEAARATLVLLVTHLLTDFMTVASAQMVIFPGLVWQAGHVQGHAALNMRPQRASRLAVTSASSLWLHIGKSTIAQETVTCLRTCIAHSMGPYLWVHIHIHIHIQIHSHDVVRRTNTTLNVLLESRIDEHWNVDGDRELAEPWTGFTQFTMLNEKPPNGYTWFGERLTKVQATSRPDYSRSFVEYVETLSQKEERQWAIIAKPKLDSARQLRGCCFIHPSDMEFKNTMTHSRNKLEVPLESAMPCRVRKCRATMCAHNSSRKTRYACVVDAHEKKTDRAIGTLNPDIMKILLLRGVHFFESSQFCAQTNPCSPSNENSGCESRS